MKSFKPGDRVVVVISNIPQMLGEVLTVESELKPVVVNELSTWWGIADSGTLMHELNSQWDENGVQFTCAYPPSHLELYRPDDREKAEWTSELRRLCGAKENA